MKKCISLKDLGIEATKDTKLILRSRPLGVREWIKNNPKEAEDNGWVLIGRSCNHKFSVEVCSIHIEAANSKKED